MASLFTPQQEAGFAAYTYKVRIGNWSEDFELANVKIKDFLRRKELGILSCQQQEKKLADAYQEVPLVSNADGILHYGDTFMLWNAKTEQVLSIDTNGKVVSTSAYPQPCVRNTFTILPYNARNAHKPGDAVCYGDKFVLECNSRRVKLYLSSSLPNPINAPKYAPTGAQELFLKPEGFNGIGYECVWEIKHIDSRIQMEMEGHPVNEESTLLISHCATNQCLAADGMGVLTSFGNECMAFCKSIFGTHTHGKQSQIMGHQNQWAIVSHL
mmetsp:Transcript_8808/g.14466  ORF Transcript_8808/g.14466 Transcript_8808/m.14466 type:complete len:270 (+) Transcript_8808:57-866(+)